MTLQRFSRFGPRRDRRVQQFYQRGRGSRQRRRRLHAGPGARGYTRPSTSRMMRLMQLFEAFAGNVSIDLRRRQIAVTQEHLHHAQIRPVIQ